MEDIGRKFKDLEETLRKELREEIGKRDEKIQTLGEEIVKLKNEKVDRVKANTSVLRITEVIVFRHVYDSCKSPEIFKTYFRMKF